MMGQIEREWGRETKSGVWKLLKRGRRGKEGSKRETRVSYRWKEGREESKEGEAAEITLRER